MAVERVIRNRPGGQRLAARRFNRGRIALLGPGADQTEQQRPHRRADAGELPIHPSLGESARFGRRGIEATERVLAR
jgi:hypothetical protein